MTDLWEHDKAASAHIDVPQWISQDITGTDIEAVLQGGCASGAYMPAVTYHEAVKTMGDHGDDVLQYIEDHGGELPAVPQGESWSGIACFFLSAAVELWALQAQQELLDAIAADDEDEDADEDDDDDDDSPGTSPDPDPYCGNCGGIRTVRVGGLSKPQPCGLCRPQFTGYDSRPYSVGDRVELHPGTDLWAQGARYGTVTGSSLTPDDRVRVELDKLPGRTHCGPEERFRKVV